MEEYGARIAAALERIEAHLARHFSAPEAGDLEQGECWRWQASALGGELIPLPAPAESSLADLIGLQEPISRVEKNTRQFLDGCAANHVLLTGGRGCGKSTLIRGVFCKYRRRGLRLIETDAAGFARLSLLQPALMRRREKYILYCDDLSFNDADPMFSRIKSAMDGALTSAGDNLLVYATSNRRNLIREQFSDNLSPLAGDGDDIQPLETQDEKIALTDRFGLRISFYAPDAGHYDRIVEHWLQHFGIPPNADIRRQARNFADMRGARSGRAAKQFAISCLES